MNEGKFELKFGVRVDGMLLGVGFCLLCLPFLLAIVAPTLLLDQGLLLRIMAALGGALVGAFIPGARMGVPLRYSSGTGGDDHPASWAQEGNAVPSNSEQLQDWLFNAPSFDGEGERELNNERVQILQSWMTKTGYREFLLATLVHAKDPELERTRAAAIRDLRINENLAGS